MTLAHIDVPPPLPPRPSSFIFDALRRPLSLAVMVGASTPAADRHLLAALDLHDVLPAMPTSPPPATPAPEPALCGPCAWSLARCHSFNPHEPDDAVTQRRRDLARQCPACIAANEGARPA